MSIADTVAPSTAIADTEPARAEPGWNRQPGWADRPAVPFSPRDATSGLSYLRWLARALRTELVGATVTGVIWTCAQAAVPAILGVAIDQGISGGGNGRLAIWTLVLVLDGLLQAGIGMIRHRFAVIMRLNASYWTTELVGAQAGRQGAALSIGTSRGELLSVANNDVASVGSMFEILAQLTGSIAAFLFVGAILLDSSLVLGGVVLIGVPVLGLAVGVLLRPLQRRIATTRTLQGELNSTASDIVAGLRVLRGIGGEDRFDHRYRTHSQRVRAAGMHAAQIQSLLGAFQVLLPGTCVVAVVWLGAQLAAHGAISPGELVAFYGYAAFLLLPLRTVTAFAGRYSQARVAADHIADFLRLPVPPTAGRVGVSDNRPMELVDPASGLAVHAGTLTVLASADPGAAAAIADRLGGYPPHDATLAGRRLDSIPRTELRRRILLSDVSATIFSGTLRFQLDPTGRRPDENLVAALDAASATDILPLLEHGLDSRLTEQGRSLSGGQLQRIVLARALLADPEVLILVEPSSAVDAHTEARMARRLRRYRAGRSTLVVSTSPLWLEQADEVAFVADGKLVNTGSHHDLLATDAVYRALIERDAQ